MNDKSEKREDTQELDGAAPTSLAKIRGSLHSDTRGLSTVEYLIILVLIAVSGLAIWKKIGGEVTGKANRAHDALKDDVKKQQGSGTI